MKKSQNDKLTISEKKYGINPDKDFDLCNVASATELTGLIPSAPQSNAMHDSYSELLEYQPQDVTIPKSQGHTKG